MCYSAMVKQHLKELSLEFKARIDEAAFRDVFRRRAAGEKIKLPRAMDLNFLSDSDPAAIDIRASIASYRAKASAEITIHLLEQQKRLANARAALTKKATQGAEKEIGIASRKIEALSRRLEKLESTREEPQDSRIYALEYAPVLVVENGQRMIKPMRYLCRPADSPESFDKDFSGCYNVRRDNLSRFWKAQFGKNHAALIVTKFFEFVKKDQGRPVEVEFKPRGYDHMIVPCVWDRSAKNWQA